MRLLAAFAAAATLATTTASGLRHVQLPRDHYGHSQAAAEWWYITSYVRGSDGQRYSVFVSVFRRGGLLLPISQVVDLDTGARIGHSEIVLPAHVGSTTVNVSTPLVTLRYNPAANTWSFAASGLLYGVRLTATPEKPYAIHGGGTGIVQLGTLESGYYSSTRTRVEGTITSAAGTVSFHGSGWFDHQWVERRIILAFPKWDWFGCQLDNRTELMLYRFLDQTGRPSTSAQGGTVVRPDGSSKLVTDQKIVAGTRALTAAERGWPVDWTIQIPSQHLNLRLNAIVPDQLFRGILVPTLWEGVATATGTKHGICFVEAAGR